jgi:anti-anti-sigma factor
MTTPLSMDTARTEDGTVALAATGEIDLSNVDVFDRALTAAIAEAGAEGGQVTVDLTAVDYLDSGAINVLFNRVEHVRVIANPVLVAVLKVSGLADLTTVASATSENG